MSSPTPKKAKTQYQIDYEYGKSREEALKPRLEAFFEEELIQNTNRYCPYDFRGMKSARFYEMKARNCSKDKYPTTMIGADKVKENYVFIFDFIDGLYYIEYDENVFLSFEKKEFRRWRTGKVDVEKPYYYIPVDRLIRMP